jgi:uncharacterized lipoprotein YajG
VSAGSPSGLLALALCGLLASCGTRDAAPTDAPTGAAPTAETAVRKVVFSVDGMS